MSPTIASNLRRATSPVRLRPPPGMTPHRLTSDGPQGHKTPSSDKSSDLIDRWQSVPYGEIDNLASQTAEHGIGVH
jgi:hypothetical protein